jgi:hypothetical protein
LEVFKSFGQGALGQPPRPRMNSLESGTSSNFKRIKAEFNSFIIKGVDDAKVLLDIRSLALY